MQYYPLLARQLSLSCFVDTRRSPPVAGVVSPVQRIAGTALEEGVYSNVSYLPSVVFITSLSLSPCTCTCTL